MNDAMAADLGWGNRGQRLYGKYAGKVYDNKDPDHLGRLQALVPEVLRDVPTGWAKPCVPYAGPRSGYFALPPLNAGVWIEFEAGDVSRPIWTGCFWGARELPLKPPETETPPEWKTRIWRTDLGLTAVLDDATKSIILSDGTGANLVEINVDAGTVTMKGAKRVINSAGDEVLEGSAKARHPGVLGDELMAYLTQLVTQFNTHFHPGQTVVGAQVIPTPPAKPMPVPGRRLLSKKVKLE
jgi:hypothetical protein